MSGTTIKLDLTPLGMVAMRVGKLEEVVGKLALQIGQFARTGIADSDNSFYCYELDEEAECRKWDGVFGPLVK